MISKETLRRLRSLAYDAHHQAGRLKDALEELTVEERQEVEKGIETAIENEGPIAAVFYTLSNLTEKLDRAH